MNNQNVGNPTGYDRSQTELEQIAAAEKTPQQRLTWHLYGVAEDVRLLANQLADGAGLEPVELNSALRRLKAGYALLLELHADSPITERQVLELLNNPHRQKGTVIP